MNIQKNDLLWKIGYSNDLDGAIRDAYDKIGGNTALIEHQFQLFGSFSVDTPFRYEVVEGINTPDSSGGTFTATFDGLPINSFVGSFTNVANEIRIIAGDPDVFTAPVVGSYSPSTGEFVIENVESVDLGLIGTFKGVLNFDTGVLTGFYEGVKTSVYTKAVTLYYSMTKKV